MMYMTNIDKDIECTHCHGHNIDVGPTNKAGVYRCLCRECMEMFIYDAKKRKVI